MSTVSFCEICDNMLYVRVTEDTKLQYVCNYCNNVTTPPDSSSVMVSETIYSAGVGASKYQQFETPLLHEDPTLPRISNVPCPNAACGKDKGAPDEVLYVKYDAAKLKFLYSCVHCKHFWTR